MSRLDLFIVGTDTGAGKTYVTSGLLAAYARAGCKAVGMKPVASGAVWRDGRLENEDVEALIAASNVILPRECINPYLFGPPASPHLASREGNVRVSLPAISAALAACRAMADVVIVEGVGGWCVPLSDSFWLADLARALELPIVLVVGIKLGCINHALLTAREMNRAGLPPCAWIATITEPALYALQEVIATLQLHLDAPLAGVLPYQQGTPQSAPFNVLASRLESVLQVSPGARLSPTSDTW